MGITHFLLIFSLMFIWAFNYVVIRVGLDGMPPIFLAFTRFFLTSFPAVFFLPKPEVPFRKIVLYGWIFFSAQFTCFFCGMALGISPSIAAVLMQFHVFFSLFLAVAVFREKLSVFQMLGAVVSFTGIIVAGINVEGTVSIWGFFSILMGALLWGAGSAISKTFGKVNMISLVVWGSTVAWPPLLLLSYLFEGPERISGSLMNMTYKTCGAVAYLTYLSTFFGYGVWSWLLHKKPLSTVVPFTLLIPIIAMFSSVVVLDEPLYQWKIVAAILVVGGLCIAFLSPLFQKKAIPQEPREESPPIVTPESAQ